MKEAMRALETTLTEQPPSAEAMGVAKAHSRDEWGEDNGGWYTLAQAIDALIAQRVSAETERWQNRDRQRLEQIDRLQAAVQSLQSARDERPASPAAVADYTERARTVMNEADRDIETLKDVPGFVVGRSTYIERIAAALSALASERDAALHAAPSPSVADYTEQARELLKHFSHDWDMEVGIKKVAAALSAVAAERDAAAMRAFGRRVWSDTEEIAYQAGVSDTRARLREPDVREALARVICVSMEEDPDAADTPYEIRGWSLYRSTARAALTKIAEMLK